MILTGLFRILTHRRIQAAGAHVVPGKSTAIFFRFKAHSQHFLDLLYTLLAGLEGASEVKGMKTFAARFYILVADGTGARIPKE